MDYFKQLIEPVFGQWTVGVVVVVLILLWAVKTIPPWLAGRSQTVHGSPSSAKYWRARFAEALEQHDGEIDSAERRQLAARVTEARIMVEAHEAKRRIGIGGVIPMWVLVALSGVVAVTLNAAGAASGSVALRWWAGAVAALMIVAELTALHASSVGTERFNVLVAAGRFGRSDLVREDPWRVLREYDYARKRAQHSTRLNERAAQDKKLTTRWIRFERAMTGISAYQNGAGLSPSEIWAPPPPTSMPTESRVRRPCLHHRRKE